MANSSTDICNLALDLLSAGTVQDVENPTDATEELLNRWYDVTRKRLLREHAWNFAAKRVILAASSTDPAFGYTKAFPVPADFVRILYINDTRYTSDVPTVSELYQFEDGNILTSDQFTSSTSLKLVYVSDFTNVSRMDPMFVDLLAHEIALKVAYKVTETNTNVERIESLRRSASLMAKAVDGQERPPKKIERSYNRHVRRNGRGREDRIIF